eukprot:TRINITY_DN4553_c0_g1_i1.p1 TRINITY_DN4553_c0_g1~~TRINITY_DN4553_c0_g1_i1.p1  ORF type:complete len:1206 (+),score=298.09 TRINITY_DN4553_c0_g1_i1:673-4290(+)
MGWYGAFSLKSSPKEEPPKRRERRPMFSGPTAAQEAGAGAGGGTREGPAPLHLPSLAGRGGGGGGGSLERASAVEDIPASAGISRRVTPCPDGAGPAAAMVVSPSSRRRASAAAAPPLSNLAPGSKPGSAAWAQGIPLPLPPPPPGLAERPLDLSTTTAARTVKSGISFLDRPSVEVQAQAQVQQAPGIPRAGPSPRPSLETLSSASLVSRQSSSRHSKQSSAQTSRQSTPTHSQVLPGAASRTHGLTDSFTRSPSTSALTTPTTSHLFSPRLGLSPARQQQQQQAASPGLFSPSHFKRSLSGQPFSGTPTPLPTPLSCASPAGMGVRLVSAQLREYTWSELKGATQNFAADNVVGEGGFGKVYAGSLEEWVPVGGGKVQPLQRKIAVKKLNMEGLQGEKEWMTEVCFLGNLEHPRLVQLLGYCCEAQQRLLVYEFVPNRSLESHLFRASGTAKGGRVLPWPARLRVAVDAAEGLAHLHEEIENPVIFRDFKAANVLLFHDLHAKLSDFGLARAGPEGDHTHVSTQVVGTPGYVAPEYALTGHLTLKSDVWSYGVVLLELLTGRRCLDKERPAQEEHLVEWARPFLADHRRLFQIMDPLLEGRYSVKAAQKVAGVVTLCLQRSAKLRPKMSEVCAMLHPLQDLADFACDRPNSPHDDVSAFSSGNLPALPSSSSSLRPSLSHAPAASASSSAHHHRSRSGSRSPRLRKLSEVPPGSSIAPPAAELSADGSSFGPCPSLPSPKSSSTPPKPLSPQLRTGKNTPQLVLSLREQRANGSALGSAAASLRERRNVGVSPLVLHGAPGGPYILQPQHGFPSAGGGPRTSRMDERTQQLNAILERRRPSTARPALPSSFRKGGPGSPPAPAPATQRSATLDAAMPSSAMPATRLPMPAGSSGEMSAIANPEDTGASRSQTSDPAALLSNARRGASFGGWPARGVFPAARDLGSAAAHSEDRAAGATPWSAERSVRANGALGVPPSSLAAAPECLALPSRVPPASASSPANEVSEPPREASGFSPAAPPSSSSCSSRLIPPVGLGAVTGGAALDGGAAGEGARPPLEASSASGLRGPSLLPTHAPEAPSFNPPPGATGGLGASPAPVASAFSSGSGWSPSSGRSSAGSSRFATGMPLEGDPGAQLSAGAASPSSPSFASGPFRRPASPSLKERRGLGGMPTLAISSPSTVGRGSPKLVPRRSPSPHLPSSVC